MMELAIISVILLCVEGSKSSFTVLEEQTRYEFVGNIVDSVDFPDYLQSEDLYGLKCSLLRKGNPASKYFTISETTGVITTAESLDREILCGHNDEPCLITLDMAMSSDSSPVKIFPVTIAVEDINDNIPKFPESEVHVSIPESAEIGTMISISGATDKDVGGNDVQTYELLPWNSLFEISVIQNLDGTPEVGIVVKERLDREKVPSYQMRVLAKDGGSPPRTGTVTINIAVTDVNDHSPVFTKSLYNVTIRENLLLDSPVVHVTASDEDEDDNGQVEYRFSSRTLVKYPKHFTINSTSGKISSGQILDYEESKSYQLVVEAIDHGNPPKSSQSLVSVSVLDMNDNPPKISFNFLSSMGQAQISEKVDMKQFIAYVSLTDKDEGENAKVDCKLDSRDFQLDKMYLNEYQVLVNTKLDREMQSQYTLNVVCQDNGIPSKTTSETFIVEILDENDNDPIFNQDVYTVTLRENLNIGEAIIKVTANDLDIGVNGNISYELKQMDGNKRQFLINKITGEISIASELDRETSPEVTLHVIARDNGVPHKEANATILINILDVNDEYPAFNQSTYDLIVMENLPASTFVGKVFAVDPDLGLGGEVEYFIKESTSGTESSFIISPENGEIRTSSMIDREEYPVLYLTIIAKDKGDPSMSSIVSVKVTILDVNDNAPVFIYPSIPGEVVLVKQSRSNFPVAKLHATDLDKENDIGLLYTIDWRKEDKLFQINPSSGEIFMNMRSHSLIGNMYKLNVSVTDNGSPPLVATSTIFVSILDDAISSSEEQIDDINLVIVVTVISVTIVISSVIVAVICVIRRRDFIENVRSKYFRGVDIESDNNTNNTLSEKKNDNQGESTPYLEPLHYIRPNTSETIHTKDNIAQNYLDPYNSSSVSDTKLSSKENQATCITSRQTWLTDAEELQDFKDFNPSKSEITSLSDISEKTFDSGRGGSDKIEGYINIVTQNQDRICGQYV